MGTFETDYPDVTDADLVGQLADSFSEAQLWGFFPKISLVPVVDEGTSSTVDWETSDDLSMSGGSLVILFSGLRVIRGKLRNLSSTERYKAGPVEMEIAKSANLLRDEMKFLTERINRLIDDADKKPTIAKVHDNYVARGGNVTQVGFDGFFSYEVR